MNTINTSNLTDKPHTARNAHELQRFATFSVCIAGKNADTMIKCVGRFFQTGSEVTGAEEPFEVIRRLDDEGVLAETLRESGIGCHNNKARCLIELARSGNDLGTCSVKDLEAIWGIGPKTARFFVLFSREDVDDIAVLDVHILRWLRTKGYDVPEQTPGSAKRYAEVERIFLENVPRGTSVADFDYEIWLRMREENRKES